MLQQHNRSYSATSGVALQDNAAQCSWYSAILAANTISNTGKLAGFFGKDSGGSFGHSDSENWWLHIAASNQDTCDQNGKPSIPTFPLSSACYYS